MKHDYNETRQCITIGIRCLFYLNKQLQHLKHRLISISYHHLMNLLLI